MGVFDRVADGFKTNAWTHDLSAFVPELMEFELATVEFREAFTDRAAGAQVFFDALGPLTVERSGLDCTGGCICAFGTVHSYTGLVLSSLFLADGKLVVKLVEGGDNIALDWSRMTVQHF